MDALKNISDRCSEEWKLKRPSYYTIESYAKLLYKTIKEWRLENPTYADDTYRIEYEADILNEDIAGILKHDYEKDLKRYKDKWVFQKNTLDAIHTAFRNIQKKLNRQQP